MLTASVFPILSHHFRLLNHVSLDGVFHLIFARAGLKVQFSVQGIKIKVVAMRAGWRTRATVAELSEVILALQAAARKFVSPWSSLWEVIFLCRDVIGHPMGEAACSRRVRVMDDQSEHLGIPGSILPGQLGRDVLTLAGELAWYIAFGRKS